ncbi:MAG TPA: hypothetical protein VE377_21910 [Candidatus Dormibacteraeota bacterium]|nr:hypothetical protein [Candidatus Dormibacteraeota bacterium]
MRRILPLLFLVVCGIRLYAQSEQHAERSQLQTGFGAEGDFDRPVAIPADALQSLRLAKSADDGLQRCAEQEGIATADIPASWFVASEIRLSRTSSSDLIVRGEQQCLGGAHIAQFWVLAKSSTGYRIVFRGRADGLSVLPKHSNGYRDLQLVIVTQAGAYVDYVNFRYVKGEYHTAGHRMEHAN